MEEKGQNNGRLEWMQIDDRVGEELLGGLRQERSDSGGENPQMPRITPGETAQKWTNKGHWAGPGLM